MLGSVLIISVALARGVRREARPRPDEIEAQGVDEVRANVDRLSMYRRCPSAYSVSNASELLPEPESPVTTVSRPRGSSTLTFFRLCVRAPRILILSIVRNRPTQMIYYTAARAALQNTIYLAC